MAEKLSSEHSSTLRMREATPADYPEMQELQITCIRGLIGVYACKDMETWVDRMEQNGPRYGDYNNLVCVTDKDRVAAFVSWRVLSSGQIECLYTRESARRRGIGSFLLRHAEANLEGRRVELRSTLSARPFYEGHDYRFVKYPHDALFPVALMEKQL